MAENAFQIPCNLPCTKISVRLRIRSDSTPFSSFRRTVKMSTDKADRKQRQSILPIICCACQK